MKTNTLNHLYQQNILKFHRQRDIDNGDLKAKLTHILDRHHKPNICSRLYSWFSGEDDRVMSLIKSSPEDQRIIVFLDANSITVTSDGNTRMYGAMLHNVDPEDIPVRCKFRDTSNPSCMRSYNCQLSEVIEKLGSVKKLI